jgi:mannose-1-phosphate guanylyltransferase
MTDQLVIRVILCGGAGTRLWPVSREKMPKQFVSLIGTLSTFQQVLDRVTREGLFAPPMIITNSEFRFVVAEQARARGVEATIVLEPQRRDSAAAIAAASELATKRIRPPSCWWSPPTILSPATKNSPPPAAPPGAIVTFGVKPTYPASSYGYIRPQPDGGSQGRSLRAGDQAVIPARTTWRVGPVDCWGPAACIVGGPSRGSMCF